MSEVLQRLTIGQLARMADVSANAVRFYEREGLMHVPAKSDSGYRLYPPDAVDRLRFIRQAQHCGLSLMEFGALLQVREQPSSCCGDVRSKVIEKKLALEARIKAMRAMSRALDELIEQCSDGAAPADSCSILTALASSPSQSTER